MHHYPIQKSTLEFIAFTHSRGGSVVDLEAELGRQHEAVGDPLSWQESGGFVVISFGITTTHFKLSASRGPTRL